MSNKKVILENYISRYINSYVFLVQFGAFRDLACANDQDYQAVIPFSR